MADVKNILVGAAQIFVSRGTGINRPVTKPATTVASASGQYAGLASARGDINWSKTQSAKTYLLGQNASWRDVGYTNNGLEVSYEPGYNDVMVDQLLDAARLFKSTLKVMLTTELTEGTLENIQLAFGQNENQVVWDQTNASAGYPSVLNYTGADSVDANSFVIASTGSTSSVFQGTTVTPVQGTASGTAQFTTFPTFNITRNTSGSVVGITMVYPGTGYNGLAGSATLAGSAQTYPTGGTATSPAFNIVVSFGAGASAAQQATLAMEAGALGDAPVERSIVAIGNAPSFIGATGVPPVNPNNEIATGAATTSTNKERVYVARRVVQVQSVSHGLKRDAATVFPVQFRCLPDDNDLYDGAEYGVIIDRVYG